MKKILVLCMILMLSFSMFACGTQSSDTDNDVTDDLTEIIDDEGTEDDIAVAYDFGFTADKDFELSGAVAKLDNAKISSEGEALTSQVQEALDGSVLESFAADPAEYDEYDGEEIDKQLYTLGMRSDLSEDEVDDAAMIEAGFYHNSTEENYHQYTSYVSKTFYEVSKTLLSEELRQIETAYGITISEQKMEEALKTVFDNLNETNYEYAVYEKQTVQGDDYTEVVTLRVDGAMYDDDSVLAYIYVDRDRVYK